MTLLIFSTQFLKICARWLILLFCASQREVDIAGQKRKRGEGSLFTFCPDMFMRADVQFAQREEDVTRG